MNIRVSNTAIRPSSFHALPVARKVIGIVSTSGNGKLLVGHMVVMGIIVASGMLSFKAPSAESRLYPYSFLTIALFAWSLWSWRVASGRLFDPYILFLTSAYLFNAGLTPLDVFGLGEYGILNGRFGGYVNIQLSEETLRDTLCLVLLCLSAFHFGALVTVIRNKKVKPEAPRIGARRPIPQDLRTVGAILIAASALPFYIIRSEEVGLRMTQGYAALYQMDRASGIYSWIYVLAAFLLPGVLFLLAGSKGRLYSLTASAICIFVITLIFLFLGYRSSAIMPLIAYGWVWHTCIKRLPALFVLGAATITLFLILPLVAYIRTDAGAEFTTISSLQNAYVSIENPVIETFHDMGGSVYTVSGTLDYVPLRRPHDLGATYVDALLNVIPNFLNPIKLNAEYGTPDVWFVNTLDPQYAENLGGLGFSFIAEAYLAFGWFGAPIVLALIAALMVKFFSWSIKTMEPAKIATVASFLSVILHYPRGAAEGYTRQLVLYALMPYLFAHLVSIYRRRSMNALSPIGSALSVPHSRQRVKFSPPVDYEHQR